MSYISSVVQNDKVLVWERTPYGRIIKEYDAPYYFYISDDNGRYKTIYDTPVSKIDCTNNRTMFYKKKKEFSDRGIRTWESDIGPDIRILSNVYYNAEPPKLNITHLDIEVDYDPEIGFSGPKNPYAPINSVSLFHEHTKELIVIAVPPPDNNVWTNELLEQECNNKLPIPSNEYVTKFVICKTEEMLLRRLLDEIEDSDVLSTWNGEKFDIPFIGKRVEIILGKNVLQRMTFFEDDLPNFVEVEERDRFRNTNPNAPKQTYIRLDANGRLFADYMLLYKKYEVVEKPSYKLESISEEVLVDENDNPILPKLEYEGSLHDLYRKDFAFFVRYNIRDCEILHGFEQKLAYIELANQMYHLSCGLFKHVTGTLKLAELAIINHCHHNLKKVVNDVTPPKIDRAIEGALVLLPQIGMHEMIGSIDINSLYPSSIRSINISPEKIFGQFVEEEDACIQIQNKTDKNLTFVHESSGDTVQASASEWLVFLLENKLSISGYGTVFRQDVPGIIPSILSSWFAMRKDSQGKKRHAEKQMSNIVAKYKNIG